MTTIPATGPSMRSTLRIESRCNPNPIERPAGSGITLDELRWKLLDAGFMGLGLDEPAVLAGLLAVLGEIERREGGSVVVMHLPPVDATPRPAGPLVKPG